jgi:3-methyladenine DNA glycosylase AlkD
MTYIHNMNIKYTEIEKEILSKRNPEKAVLYARFFKTGKGEYGEGDIFLGLNMPVQRVIANKFKDIDLDQIGKLLQSEYHEFRMIGLIILTYQFPKAGKEKQKEIFDFYIANKDRINNWDLVDVTTPRIVGGYLIDKDKKILYKLAKSESLWDRRISILATFWFIRDNQFTDSISIAEILLGDKHDLIHKAVGWMLREIGKRDEKILISFLDKHSKTMPRTMLRYSIEKLDEKRRRVYMQ